ncbi:MAG: aldo/keto reductase [Spirochaetes bacterium]|nr:aldo/keto reductase [Spirochaetota bacterium]
METKTCGTSGLSLSALGLGCWAFGGGDYWGAQDQKDVDAVVHRAYELGINYFDTAEAYNEGRSEEALGRAIQGLPREKLVIGTKISPSNTESKTLIAHCEASLKRLAVDVIDLYMVHWPITPHSILHFTKDAAVLPTVEDAFVTLGKLRAQGKIRHVGVSNFGVKKLAEAASFGVPIVMNELPYSLLTRAIEQTILPHCAKNGIGVLGYMSLLQGVISDKFNSIEDIPAQRKRTRHFDARKNAMTRHRENGFEKETEDALRGIRNIARKHGMRVTDLALAWAVANSSITCSLVGARNEQQLIENVNAAKPIDASLIAELNSATEPLKLAMGPSFDYYENTADDRTV